MNGIKSQQKFSYCLKSCNNTSLYKNMGPRKYLNKYRGIFGVSIFCNILDRLMNSNVGDRRGRNIRDNIYVLSAITNSIKKGNAEACDVIVTDVKNVLIFSGHKNA